MSIAWVFALGKVCMECHYPLAGLPTFEQDGHALAKCPECGTDNITDYHDRSTELTSFGVWLDTRHDLPPHNHRVRPAGPVADGTDLRPDGSSNERRT
jgi:hypothetical protein